MRILSVSDSKFSSHLAQAGSKLIWGSLSRQNLIHINCTVHTSLPSPYSKGQPEPSLSSWVYQQSTIASRLTLASCSLNSMYTALLIKMKKTTNKHPSQQQVRIALLEFSYLGLPYLSNLSIIFCLQPSKQRKLAVIFSAKTVLECHVAGPQIQAI